MRRVLLAVLLGCWALPAWGQVVDRVVPVSFDDSELTGETTIEEAIVSGSLTVTSWPTSGIAGFSDTGELEDKTPGDEFTAPAPVVLSHADGTETYFGQGEAGDTAAELGTALIAAQTAFVAGDWIDAYNSDIALPSRFGKDDLRCTFHDCSLSSATASAILLGDGNTSMDVAIFGNAEFSTSGDDSKTLYLQHASSAWVVYGRSIRNTHAGLDAPAIASAGLSCVVYMSESVYSGGYDGVWGFGAGLLEVHSPSVYGKDNGIEFHGGGTTNVFCETLGSGEVTILRGNADTGGTCYVSATKSITVDAASTIDQAVSLDAGNGATTLTIVCPSVQGHIDLLNGPTFEMRGNKLAGKISGSSPTLILRGVTVDASANSGTTVNLVGGTATLYDSSIISHSGATNSFSGSSGATLAVYGSCATNKAVAGVTTTGSGTLVTGGKVLTVSNTLTLAGTDSSTLNVGAGGTLGTGAYAAAFNPAIPGAIGGTTPAAGTFTTLGATASTITGGTVTSSTPVIDATQTWNSAGTTFTGILLNVTDTAKADASMLLDLQRAGTSMFAVKGRAGNTGHPTIYMTDSTTGWYRNTSNQWTWTSGGADAISIIGNTLVRFAPGIDLVWTASSSTTSADTGLERSAAGVLRATDGGSGAGAMIASDVVVNDTDGATLTAAQVGGHVYSNTGASGGQTFNLPAAAAGMRATFVISTADDVNINPDNADVILGLTNAAGDAISSDATIGSHITLVAVDAVNWCVVASAGTWTDVN